jgi:hypothetical protein
MAESSRLDSAMGVFNHQSETYHSKRFVMEFATCLSAVKRQGKTLNILIFQLYFF